MIPRSKTQNLQHRDHLHPVLVVNGQASYGKMLGGPNAAIKAKRFKRDHPADNRNDGQEQGNLTYPGPSPILKNSFN